MPRARAPITVRLQAAGMAAHNGQYVRISGVEVRFAHSALIAAMLLSIVNTVRTAHVTAQHRASMRLQHTSTNL